MVELGKLKIILKGEKYININILFSLNLNLYLFTEIINILKL